MERGGEIFAIDLTSQEVSFVLIFVQKAVLPAKNGSIRQPKTFISLFFFSIPFFRLCKVVSFLLQL